ncbi:transcriptional regulator [Pleurocapsa sp. CCALA 161]|uniref:P-II family nitrogen regulator n=1 Tax=Pleurocapsa sp. CCALA 161 TaxID=2107688 RepID=UPI000D06A285|nr:transcriptional regulator [Pleurocapsa sp. CCALA 161]PSB07499.1 transcriptional regulator [Pleurocapsa sp. CCALA 161]
MQSVHKVEIILSSLKLEQLLTILDQVNVSGYTVIDNTTGKGDRGFTDTDLDRVFSNAYVLTVCTNEEQLNLLIAEITPLLKKVGETCLVSAAAWIDH